VSDRKPQPGDMVQVTLAGEWIDDERGQAIYDPVSGWRYDVPKEATVEVLAPPRCGAIEGMTGLECGLPKGHPLHEDHEATHDPETADHDGVGYRLSVRWPWSDYDKDKPLPEWEMELLEMGHAPKPGPRPPRRSSPHGWEPRVFHAKGDGLPDEPPEDVASVVDVQGDHLDRVGDWRWIGRGGDGYPLIAKAWENHVLAKYAPYREVQP
jgi:hypothetical protein